jgi:lysophospholipase L1-like esterase
MNILISGDSLAMPRPNRINDYKFEKELAIHFQDTYGYLLQMEMQKYLANKNSMVINRAQRGATIKTIHQEIINHVFFFQPDILILQVGIVDCWIRPEVEQKQYVLLEEFIQCYLDIISLIKKRPEMKCIFIGICPTSDKMESRTPGLLLEIMKYNFVLKSEADGQQIFYINMEEYISSSNTNQYLLPDDSHLNKDGNSLIAKLLFDIIQSHCTTEI